MNDQSQQIAPLTIRFYVSLLTLHLWQRPLGLFGINHQWLSFRLNDASEKLETCIVRHLDTPETYLLLKRIYDAKSASEKAEYKDRFMLIRKYAIKLFGEPALLEASKKLKLEPDKRLPSLSEVHEVDIYDASAETLTLLMPSKPKDSPATQALSTSPPEREPFRVPVNDPEAVAACFELLKGVLDELRKSYLYNAPRLATLAAKLETSDLTEKETRAAILVATGPLLWIKSTHPELAMQINVIETTMEQCAVMGALGKVELAGAAFLGHWQKALRRWQNEVDNFFPTLNKEEGEAK